MSKRTKTRRLTRGNSKLKTKALIVVAHPDDETLFMVGPLLKKVVHVSNRAAGAKPCRDWTIACVTDANGNGEGTERMALFQKACRKLGAKAIGLGFPDDFQKDLGGELLLQKLRDLGENWTAVYTHGALGEYGHIHHQNVSLAVHEVFEKQCPVWSVSNNVAADLVLNLSSSEFRKKTEVLKEFYFGEIRKFLNLIPLHSSEAFNRLTFKQVRSIQAAARGETVVAKDLGPYAWLYPLLKEGDWNQVASQFFKIYFSDSNV